MDIGSLIGRAWQKLSADLVNCILLFFVGALAAGLIGGLTLGILGIPILAGMYKGFRNVARGGKAEIGDAFSEFNNIGYWFKLWLVLLVLGIVVIILNLIPILGQLAVLAISLVAGYLLFFLFPLMIERRLEAMDAIKTSIADMKSNVGKLLGPVIVTMIIIQAGSLALGLGILLTAPLGYIMMWLIYDEFYGNATLPTADSMSSSSDTFTSSPTPPPAE